MNNLVEKDLKHCTSGCPKHSDNKDCQANCTCTIECKCEMESKCECGSCDKCKNEV